MTTTRETETEIANETWADRQIEALIAEHMLRGATPGAGKLDLVITLANGLETNYELAGDLTADVRARFDRIRDEADRRLHAIEG